MFGCQGYRRMTARLVFGLGLALSGMGAQAQVSPEKIEKRAGCITNEGADLPGPGFVYKPQPGPPVPPNAECDKKILDGEVCQGIEGEPERACLVKEIAVWDGVLDRLVDLSKDKKARQASLKGTIAAFRTYRDKSCATYRFIAVNTPPPNTVHACRLSESTKFAQSLYMYFYSP